MNELTLSQQTLLSLIKKSLFNIDFVLQKDVDWEDVYREALLQAVVPLVYDGTCNLNLPKEVEWKFKNTTISILNKNDTIVEAQKKLIKLLEENHINYVILKGLSVARYYPNPTLRVLGDVDFLVSVNDIDKARKVLEANSFKYINDFNDHFHCTLRFNDVDFEMHKLMSNLTVDNDRKTNEYLSHCLEYKVYYNDFRVLPERFQIFSLLLHMREHLRLSGLGLRQLIDWTIFVKSNIMIFDENFMDILKKCGLFKLCAYICKISERIFDQRFNINFNYDYNEKICQYLISEFFVCGNLGVKSFETSESNQIIGNNKEIKHKVGIKRYIQFFCLRADENWNAVKKYPKLKIFAPLYLPLRYLIRMATGKRKKVNYFSLLKNTNIRTKLFNELEI